jgi:hypothetical protein
VFKTIKSIEAETRLGFIADVSMLFADKNERGHIKDLIRQYECQTKPEVKTGKLMRDNSKGQGMETNKYIPGVTYVVE